ncbi:hypothetical protein EG328_001093 [Venturia inaequalis]|uniref:Uncharacterized protein n=1 Tax=Venturia inaequalis TaxID=5025 RepID=A0A8H3Z440_VENIN|nr:hypothetical protein EG328_001093 [Venturia inaequalis]
MTRPHVPPNPPRPTRPGTTKPTETTSHTKEKPTSTRKRVATEDPYKKPSKTRKTTTSRPGLDLSNDPPYDQVEGTVHRLIKGWNYLKAENQKLEQKILLWKRREGELVEQVRKLVLIQRAADTAFPAYDEAY